MDRRVTSPTWGPPPPCKQALNRNESVHRTMRLLFFFSHLLCEICVKNLHYESVLISKNYTTTKNTVDRQYTKRGQL